MSDQITVKGGGDNKFQPHPEGQFVAQCVDTIDLGDTVESFPGTPEKLAHKCVIVFRTGEKNESTGEFIDIGREFTVSMNEKANLRKFLEQWRGKPYDAHQIEEGVPLHKLTGNHGLLTISHKTSGTGRTYANVTACVGIPKQMASTVEKYDGYKRADYWADKAKGYADLVKKFRAENAPTTMHDDDFADFPAPIDDEADLPF